MSSPRSLTRKQLDEALKKSEEKFSKIFWASPLLIALLSIKDYDHRYLEVNDKFEQISGWKRNEVIGRTPHDISIFVDPDQRTNLARRLVSGGTVRNVEIQFRRKDGEIRTVLGSAELVEIDGEPCILSMAVDITDRKLVEEALRESEERFRLAAQAGRMYAFDWDAITDLIVRSEESTRIFGSTGEPTKFTKRELLDRVHPEDRARFMKSLAECTPESPYTQISYRLLRPDGSVLWLERTGHAFFDKEGRMVRMIGMAADITERKLAEEALSTVSQKLIEAHEEERTWVARELHDDINQRLALLAVQLDDLKPGEARKQVEDLASDIQTLSHRLHSPKLEYLGLEAAVASFCRELSDRQGVDIDFHPENVPRELSREISLSLFRVLQEALQNAVKHSGSRNFQVSLKGEANEIELTVHDSGIGFNPEEAIKGRGLGLTSMRERLKLVNGDLSIEAQLQHGTTIRARVPLHPETKATGAAG
jgi:PAS domain S-box-containing protein